MFLSKAGAVPSKVSHHVVSEDPGENWEAVEQNGVSAAFWHERDLKTKVRTG